LALSVVSQAMAEPVELPPGFGDVRVEAPSVPPPAAHYVDDFGHPSSLPVFVLHTAEPRLVAVRLKGENTYAAQMAVEREGHKWFRYPLKSTGSRDHRAVDSGWQTLELVPGSYSVMLGHPTAGVDANTTATLQVVDLEPKSTSVTRKDLAAGPLVLDGLRGAPLGLQASWPTSRSNFSDTPSKSRVELPKSLGCRSSWRSDVPIAVLEAKEALGRTRLRLVRGAGRGILVKDATGAERCSPPVADDRFTPSATVTVDAVPAGRVEVYALPGFYRDGSGTWVGAPLHPTGELHYTLEVEDLDRPRFRTDVPAMAVGVPVAEPRAFEQSQAGAPASTAERCGVQAHTGKLSAAKRSGSAPVVVLDVDRPVETLVLRAVGAEAGAVVVEGPLSPDGRVLDDALNQGRAKSEVCLSFDENRPMKVPRLEPGRYAVFLAGEGTPPSATLLVQDAATPEDPTRLWRPPPEGALPLDARMATRYFGSYTAGASCVPSVRQALFLAAPVGLFVWTTIDVDRSSAELGHPLTASSAELETLEYPRKNEPLVLLSTRLASDGRRLATLLSADGNEWIIDVRYIGLDRAGPPALPQAMRNLSVQWSDVEGHQNQVSVAAGKEVDELGLMTAKKEKIEACIDKRLSAQRPDYVVIRHNSTQEVRSDGVIEAAERACGLPAWDKARHAMTKRVDARLRADGAAQLARIAARFAP
jgi:hypothetical protein